MASGLQKKENARKLLKQTETIKQKSKSKSLAKQKSFQVTFKSFGVRNLLQRRWKSVPCSWCGVGKGLLTEFQSRAWLFISYRLLADRRRDLEPTVAVCMTMSVRYDGA